MSWIKIQSEYNELDKYKNDYKTIVYYKKNTSLVHNPYGPAIIYLDGSEIYCIDGKLHRLDGPAKISKGGQEEYYINGENINKKEFEYHPKRLKFLGKEHLACLK